MKRINYGGGELVTDNSVAVALLEYAQYVIGAGASVAVDNPALEVNGSIANHTILIGPATQREVHDINGFDDAQDLNFPVPTFPSAGYKGLAANLENLPDLTQLYPAGQGCTRAARIRHEEKPRATVGGYGELLQPHGVHHGHFAPIKLEIQRNGSIQPDCRPTIPDRDVVFHVNMKLSFRRSLLAMTTSRWSSARSANSISVP
ncbi:MAG: hypothetical protein ABI124_08485 [Terrimesophilobacter sp.]